MKTVVLFPLLLLSFFFQDTARLKGMYKVEFEKGIQGYQMTFNDSTYVKKMPDAVTYKGKITYTKYKINVRQNADDDPIEIDRRETTKDTIAFAVKSKRDISRTIARGKMIRIK